MRFANNRAMFSTATTAFLIFLLPYWIQQAQAAICSDTYLESYPSATAESLVCEEFPGDPSLHAIVYGCISVNQDTELPDGLVSQSFNRKCIADVGDDTTFICHELALDTDYSAFTAAVDPTIECTNGEKEFDMPLFQYQESTASYQFSGALGEQGSSGTATAEFQPQLAQGVYYINVVQAGEAPLQFNDAPGDEEESDGDGDPPETMEPAIADGNNSTEPPAQPNDEEIGEEEPGEEDTSSTRRGFELGKTSTMLLGISAWTITFVW